MKPERAAVMMIATRPNKAQYTEVEAAEVLGITVERLRCLVKDHILTGEEEDSALSHACYQPSDLLVLRFLTSRGVTATSPC
jgi:predicted transcriptional regulator